MLLLLMPLLRAQNNYARVAAGFNYGWPQLKKGYASEPWKGVHIRSKFLEFGYMSGHGTTPAETSTFGFDAYAGVNIPFLKAARGKRAYGLKGFYVVPFIAANIGLMAYDGKAAFQGTVAPGLSLQLPYTVVDFRLNTVISAKEMHGLIGQRLLLLPTFAFQLDALWDVMDPQLHFDGHYEGVYTNTYENVSYEETDYAIYKTTTTTTTYQPYSYDVYKYNVGPHISAGPRVSYWNLKKGPSTLMFGLVQSGRAHGFGYDLIGERGTVESKSNGYTTTATRAMARLSFDLNRSAKGFTQFTRLMAGAGVGYCWFENSGEHATATNGQFINAFISYELGAVSFSLEKNFSFYNGFESQQYFSFAYRLPFERLHDRYQQLRQSK